MSPPSLAPQDAPIRQQLLSNIEQFEKELGPGMADKKSGHQ
jgi:hypothetical protein